MATSRPIAPDPPILRGALIPASLVVVFFLIYAAGVPFVVAASASIPFLALFLLAPFWARRSLAAFDRDMVRLLTTDRKTELPRRLRRALGMRLFAPPAWVHERKGVIASELREPGEARAAYRKAMAGYEEEEAIPVGVLLGYAHASYALGDDIEAIKSYRRVLALQGTMPNLERNLAHALIRRGEDPQQAAELLDRAADQARDDGARAEIKLLRALAAAKASQKATAKELLREAEPAGPSGVALRDEVREELGLD